MTLGIRKTVWWRYKSSNTFVCQKMIQFLSKKQKVLVSPTFYFLQNQNKVMTLKNECILSLVLVFLPLAYEFFAYLWWKICFGVGIQEYWVCLHLPLVLGWGQYKVWWPQRPFGGWKTLLQHLFSPKPLMLILLKNSSDVFTNLFHYFFHKSFSVWAVEKQIIMSICY